MSLNNIMYINFNVVSAVQSESITLNFTDRYELHLIFTKGGDTVSRICEVRVDISVPASACFFLDQTKCFPILIILFLVEWCFTMSMLGSIQLRLSISAI